MNFSHFLPTKTTVKSRWSSWVSRTCFATTLLLGLGASLLLNGSCANELNVTDTPQWTAVDTANSEVMTFGFSLDNAPRETRSARATRATEEANLFVNGGLNETKINNMYVLFYEGDTQRGIHSTVKGDLMLYPQGNTNPLGVATADALTGQARVFVKKNGNPYQGKNLKLVVIANFHGALTDLQGKTLTQLGALVSSGANVLGAQSNPTEKQTDFLMDGAANVQTYRWNNNQREIAVNGTVALRRAAAKLRVRLTPPTNIRGNAGENFTVVGNPQIALVNGVSNTNVLSETMLESGRTYINNGQTDFQNMEKRAFDGTQFFARPIPFYVYAHAWGNDVNNETYLLIKLRLRANNRDKDSYYKIQLKNVLPPSGTVENWNRIVRNTVYDIQSTITAEGSAEPTNPVTIQSSIAVEDWTATKPVDGSIAEAHYLVVTQTKPEMRATDELEIQYISDLPLDEATLRNSLRATYPVFDQSGNSTTNSADMSKIAVSLTSRGGRTFIKVKSPVPINYVPLTITFTAKQKDSNVLPPVPVTVSQLPPIYVTAKQSIGRVYSYWTSFFGVNIPGYGTQNSSTLFTIHTIVPQEGMLMGDPVEADGSTKRDAESNKLISPEFMLSSHWRLFHHAGVIQYGEWSGEEIFRMGNADRIDLEEYDRLMKKWNTTGYYSLTSDEKREERRLSKRFSSQDYNLWKTGIDFTSGGVANVVKYSPLKEDGTKWYPVDYFPNRRAIPYKSAAHHAKEYFEDSYGINGPHIFVGMEKNASRLLGRPMYKNADYNYFLTTVGGNMFKVNGSWRLPTTAELQLIVKIQNDPNSAVKYLFAYDAGWAAETGVAVNLQTGAVLTNRQTSFSCPIFDTYKHR